MAINKISNEKKEKILRKTAFSLPDNPSELGMTPTQIKQAFYKGFVDNSNSISQELDRVIDEINLELDSKVNQTDNELITTNKNVVGAINEIKSQINDLPQVISNKQDIVDNNLQTNSKEITSAINEINRKNFLLQESIDNCVPKNYTHTTYNSITQTMENLNSSISLDSSLKFEIDTNDNLSIYHQKSNEIEIDFQNKKENTLKTIKINTTGIFEDDDMLLNNSKLLEKLKTVAKNITLDEVNNKLIFTMFDETTKEISLNQGSILASSGSYAQDNILYLKLSNGEFINVDLSNIINAYTAGEGIKIENNQISLSSKVPTKTSELENDSGYLTESNMSNVGQVTYITDTTSTNPSVLVEHNKEYRFLNPNGVTSINVEIPSVINDEFYSVVVFNSGTTAASLTFSGNTTKIRYKGDDCLNNRYTLSYKKCYELLITYNGTHIIVYFTAVTL